MQAEALPARVPCFVLNGQRWMLPVIALAQARKQLPTPVTLVVFDRSPDNRDPDATCMDEIRRVRRRGASVDAIAALCRDRLSPQNDDWLVAAMELGLIGHVVTFGVEERLAVDLREYTDGTGFVHYLEYPELPGQALCSSGSLCAVDRRDALSRLWRILGWLPILPPNFAVGPGAERIVLSLDLSCFAVHWRDYAFPWPEEVFVNEFGTPSPDRRLAGMTGRDVVAGLMARSGMTVIAREPGQCGGEAKTDAIMSSVNRFLFGGQLSPVPPPAGLPA